METHFTREECSNCGLKPALFLFYVWHNGRYLHICTGCVLNLHQGAFCPICFNVYDNENSPPENFVNCSGCKAVCHFTCIPVPDSTISGFPTPSSSSSFSTSAKAWVCPFCSDPNLKFFQISRDERGNGVKIDSFSASQMLAAATISNISIQKAVTMTKERAEILATEAAQAEKEAKEALLKFQELTLEPQEDSKSESEFVSDDTADDDDDYGSDDETENCLHDENDNKLEDTFECGPQDGSSEFQYVHNWEGPSENELENEAWDDIHEDQSIQESDDESNRNTSGSSERKAD